MDARRSRFSIAVAALVGAVLLAQLHCQRATTPPSPPPPPPPPPSPPPPPPPAGIADPTLLPVASGQAPNTTAYNALNLPGRAAGYSYDDPVTGVKIWKVTSATVPTNNTSAGHDYADGGNRASRGWGTNGNTHTLLIRGDGMDYWLVDFTRGVGFSNYREIPAAAQPDRDLCFTFSNKLNEPRIAYIVANEVLIRFNTATMAIENTGNFPRTVTNHFAWLHQDKNDRWFVGVLNGNTTGWAFNSETGQFLTHNETWSDELRLERDGRYAVFSDGGPRVRVWDLSDNTFLAAQNDAEFWFAHLASLRSRWVTADVNALEPWAEDRYQVGATGLTKTQILNQSAGTLVHHSGNWIQTDSALGGDLDKQWSFVTGYEQNTALLWRMAVGVQRADGSDQRLLLHHYSDNPPYFGIPWGTPSPDGRVVLFNSNMNGSTRYDLFVAEMPLKTTP